MKHKKTELTGYPDSDAENDQSEHQKDDSPSSGKLRAHARHLPAENMHISWA